MPTPPRQRWPAGACDPPAQTSPRAGGEPTDVPVAAGEPTVATPEPTCTLDLLVDGAWQTRAQVRCPGDEGLTFPVAGDVGRPGELLSASAGQMHAICEELGCSLMLLPGDLIYGPGEQADATWRAVWDDTLAGLDLPALAVFGNHAYRHEPGPARRREVLLASDGRAGFVLPGPSWTARVARDGEALVAFAGLDTDSLAVPRPDAPGLGEQALHDACATGAPVVLVGHHPASSQGLHHDHEHHVRRGLRALSRAVIQGDGCRLVLATAGHDHDQQVVPPGCQEALNPGIVVSGVAARGYRVRGSSHLEPCPASGANGSYHFGPREAGGFALVRVRPGDGATTVTLYDVPAAGERTILGEVSW
jgi:hypothetical protein